MRSLLFASMSLIGCLAGCGPAGGRDAYTSRQLDNLVLRIRHLEDRVAQLEQCTGNMARLAVASDNAAAEQALLRPVSLSSVGVSRTAASMAQASRPQPIESAGAGDPFTRDVQAALKRAGFDPGPVDGKMGDKTREAIERFQRAKRLKVTGSATPATWRLLKKHL